MNYEIPYRTIDTKRIKINLGAFLGNEGTILSYFFLLELGKENFLSVNG
jgi:hypothetical protein